MGRMRLLRFKYKGICRNRAIVHLKLGLHAGFGLTNNYTQTDITSLSLKENWKWDSVFMKHLSLCMFHIAFPGLCRFIVDPRHLTLTHTPTEICYTSVVHLRRLIMRAMLYALVRCVEFIIYSLSHTIVIHSYIPSLALNSNKHWNHSSKKVNVSKFRLGQYGQRLSNFWLRHIRRSIIRGDNLPFLKSIVFKVCTCEHG